MQVFGQSNRSWFVAVAAMLLTACLPTSLEAAWIGLQNGVKANVIVVITTVTNNVAVTDKPKAMFASEVSWMPVSGPVAKIIEIYDQTGKVLLYSNRATPHVCGGKADQFFSIVAAPGGKVNVVPSRPPSPPPAR